MLISQKSVAWLPTVKSESQTDQGLDAVWDYYFLRALANFRRQKAFFVLVSAILGAGIGIFVTVFALINVLSGDPIPQKSERLLSVSLNQTSGPRTTSDLLPYPLVSHLASASRFPVAISGSGYGAIESDDGKNRRSELIRFTNATFFSSLDVPLASGRFWNHSEEAGFERVVVITTELANVLFNGEQALGRDIRINEKLFRVVGTIGAWRPIPRFYDLSMGSLSSPEAIYLPLTAVSVMDDQMFMTRQCAADQLAAPPRDLFNSACRWVNVWVLLPNESTSDNRSSFNDLLRIAKSDGYLPVDTVLSVENVRELLRRADVVPGNLKAAIFLATSFLALCIVNAVGLLYAMCQSKSQEFGIRRALGARRRDIALQLVVEITFLVGLASTLLGGVFAFIGAYLISQMPNRFSDTVGLDLKIFVLALLVAFASSLMAAALPAWRASRIDPAIQIKVE